MPYLTFLDYSALENTGKDIESKVEQKDREISFCVKGTQPKKMLYQNCQIGH